MGGGRTSSLHVVKYVVSRDRVEVAFSSSNSSFEIGEFSTIQQMLTFVFMPVFVLFRPEP